MHPFYTLMLMCEFHEMWYVFTDNSTQWPRFVPVIVSFEKET